MNAEALTLTPIGSASADYPFVEGLLHAAFPECERRDDDAQRHNTDHETRFCCLLISNADGPVGVLTYWDFDDFRYVEHFAIDERLRCHRYGQRALNDFIAMSPKPVVLEVERPDTELARRRIRFYERYGLQLWDGHDYLQPPYRASDSPVPMYIMASAPLDPSKDYPSVRDTIYWKVYKAGN